MKYWSLREELYLAFHQWQQIVIFFVLGCLLGFSMSRILPPTYRAVTQMYVALNPYRAFSDSNFLALASPKYSNIDDYKNWQMAELESAIFLDEIIEETHSRLQEQNEYWKNVNTSQLREMLNAEWRSAGTWNLVAEGDSPDRIQEAVKTWSDVATRHVSESVQASQRTISIDERRKSVEEQLIQSTARQETLEATNRGLNLWIEKLQNYQNDQSFELTDQWQISSIISSAADFSPNWLSLLASKPVSQASPEKFLEWISQVQLSIESENLILADKILSLKKLSSELDQQYSKEFRDSYGLSPNLFVEQNQFISIRKLQPTSASTLIGGVLGLLLWVLLQLARITRKTSKT